MEEKNYEKLLSYPYDKVENNRYFGKKIGNLFNYLKKFSFFVSLIQY